MRHSRIVQSSCLLILKPYLFSFNNFTKTSSKSLTTTALKTIDESDVGIFCYISKLQGFRGILKQRYSDFIVNEVDYDGNVVHLTSLDAPQGLVNGKETKSSDEFDRDYISEIESFRSLAGESNAERLQALIDQISSGVVDDVSPIVLSPSSDKFHRTVVHNFFKEKLKFLVTDTVDGPDASSKCIRVRLDSGKYGVNGRTLNKRKNRGDTDTPFDRRGSDNGQEHVGKFLRFHLYKENKETHEAIALIGKMLGIQPKSFGFAGTKDKRSVSTQRVTVFKQHASKLAALNARLFGIKVGDFCHVKEGLQLGQLLGNRFTITLRGVVADSEDIIKASANSLRRYGFINYFGLQRFGSGSVSTHLIGATLFRGEWKAAVSMILDPREGERDPINMAKEYYKESGDIEGTLRQLPRHLVADRAILQSLKKCPGNYLQALMALPRTLRMMYVHSYQSYLWNHAASMRLQMYGSDQVVIGDLVYSKEACTEKVSGIVKLECHNISDDLRDCSHSDQISETDVPEEITCPVKALTAKDLRSGNYTVEDVILPLPGSRVIYPTNNVAEVYHNLAKKEAINLAKSNHNVNEFSITSMTRSYRRVFQKPMDFEWELLTYSDGNIPLSETDLENITQIKEEKPYNNGSKNGNVSIKCVEKPEMVKDETQMALKLSFTLPASCYATMAIRELLKTSTSVAFHKTLNK